MVKILDLEDLTNNNEWDIKEVHIICNWLNIKPVDKKRQWKITQ